MADADGRAGVLARGEFALGRNDLVEQHGVSHELVVVGGLGIVEDVAQLLQVGGTQVERHVAVSGFGQEFEASGVDLEDLAAVAFDDFHVILRQQTVLGFVFPDGERLLINEISHNRDARHAARRFSAGSPCSREASCAALPPAINRMQAAPGIPCPHTGA